MVRITLVYPDGAIEQHEHDGDPKLEDYYEWLDCSIIERVPCQFGNYEMIVDEEGLLTLQAHNPVASIYANKLIVGTVVLQPPGTLK
jgi:hypothetical protein